MGDGAEELPGEKLNSPPSIFDSTNFGVGMDGKTIEEFSSAEWTLEDLRDALDSVGEWADDSVVEFTFRHERGREGTIRITQSED